MHFLYVAHRLESIRHRSGDWTSTVLLVRPGLYHPVDVVDIAFRFCSSSSAAAASFHFLLALAEWPSSLVPPFVPLPPPPLAATCNPPVKDSRFYSTPPAVTSISATIQLGPQTKSDSSCFTRPNTKTGSSSSGEGEPCGLEPEPLHGGLTTRRFQTADAYIQYIQALQPPPLWTTHSTFHLIRHS